MPKAIFNFLTTRQLLHSSHPQALTKHVISSSHMKVSRTLLSTLSLLLLLLLNGSELNERL